jgi:hypothetical protein
MEFRPYRKNGVERTIRRPVPSFPSFGHDTPLRENNVLQDGLHPALRALGLPQAGLHAFRHGCNRRWELSGLNAAVIRQQIGLTKMNPTDAKNCVGYEGQKSLKVYRGVDDPSHTIQAGDFVTTSKESAQNYGKHVQEMEVSPSELRYVRGHKDGDPKLLDIGGQTELIYAPRKAGSQLEAAVRAKAAAKLGKKPLL